MSRDVNEPISFQLLTNYSRLFLQLDLRLSLSGRELDGYHGIVPMGINLREILKVVVAFLDQHKTEGIFVRVKNEVGFNETTFVEALETHVTEHGGPKRFWRSRNLPIMKQLRGKIVIIRDFGTSKSF